MLSIAPIPGGKANYYLRLARDDYYTNGGEPPGLWLGSGAADLGLSGKVEKEAFRGLLKGFFPTARRSSRTPGARTTRRRGT